MGLAPPLVSCQGLCETHFPTPATCCGPYTCTEVRAKRDSCALPTTVPLQPGRKQLSPCPLWTVFHSRPQKQCIGCWNTEHANSGASPTPTTDFRSTGLRLPAAGRKFHFALSKLNTAATAIQQRPGPELPPSTRHYCSFKRSVLFRLCTCPTLPARVCTPGASTAHTLKPIFADRPALFKSRFVSATCSRLFSQPKPAWTNSLSDTTILCHCCQLSYSGLYQL